MPRPTESGCIRETIRRTAGFLSTVIRADNEGMTDLSLLELRAKSDDARADFLETDLALCDTFADLFNTELEFGHRDDAHHTLETAEEGYATISRFLPSVENPMRRDEIARKLTALRKTLDGMQRRLQP